MENVLHEKPYDRVTRGEMPISPYTWLRIVRGIGSRKAYLGFDDWSMRID